VIGHNQPSFDAVVEESLLRGLYLTHLNALVCCIQDPRLAQRHRLVLARIVQRINVKTGLAYPGRSRLASDIVFYAHGEAKRYSERTIGTTIHELIEYGYLVTNKRAPEGGGRALSHYAITKPSVEELQKKIAEACDAIRNQVRRTFPPANSPVDDNPEVAVKSSTETNADDNPGVAVRSPHIPKDNPPVVDNPGVDDNPMGVSDDNPVDATVTGKRTGREGEASPSGQTKTTQPQSVQPRTAQPSGGQYWLKPLNPDAAERIEFAASQVTVSKTGKVMIGPEFHADLRQDFTDSQIERGLEKAAPYMDCTPEKRMAQVRRACGWAKDDDRKEAARAPRKSGITGRSGRRSL
jgi:hypothetical protein